jgi:hypothetical protein
LKKKLHHRVQGVKTEKKVNNANELDRLSAVLVLFLDAIRDKKILFFAGYHEPF